MYKSQKLYWEEKFTTGDESLDFQHKYLFETFNKLGDAIERGENTDRVGSILGRIRFYADWHFTKEEELMEYHKCPAAQANKNAHAAFRDMFNIYHEEYIKTGGSAELAIRIRENLSDWLIQHILVVDASLCSCIQKAEQQHGL